MLGLTDQAVAMAAAVTALVQGEGASWRTLPLSALPLIPNGLLLASVADVFAYVGVATPNPAPSTAAGFGKSSQAANCRAR